MMLTCFHAVWLSSCSSPTPQAYNTVDQNNVIQLKNIHGNTGLKYDFGTGPCEKRKELPFPKYRRKSGHGLCKSDTSRLLQHPRRAAIVIYQMVPQERNTNNVTTVALESLAHKS